MRFCAEGDTSALCRIVIFNDDEFSHWVFFTGFVLINAVLLFLQAAHPWTGGLRPLDWALLIFNGLFIGVGIFANLAFEEIGLDLYVVALLALLSAFLLWRTRPGRGGVGWQPLFIYYTTAYWLGLVATFVAINLPPL